MSEEINQNNIQWMRDALDEQKETLKEIKNQTTITNGRIKSLELWRAGVIGRVTGISMAVSAVMTVVFALLKLID